MRKTKLSNRLIAAFLIISLLPSLVLAFFSNSIYTNSIEKRVASSTQQSLQLLNNNVVLVLDEYSSYLDKLSISADLQKFLFDNRFGSGKQSDLTKIVDSLSFMNAPELRSIVIMDTGGNMLINKGYTSFLVGLLPNIASATDTVSPKDYVVYCETADKAGCVAICRKIYDNKYSLTHLGYIVLFLHSSVFENNIFPDVTLGEGSELLIANSNRQPVAFQNGQLPDDMARLDSLLDQAAVPDRSEPYIGQIPDADSMIVYSYSPQYALFMFSINPYTTLNREVNWVRSLVIAVTIVLLIICLVLSMAIYFSVIIPVKATVSVCEKSETDDVPMINDDGQDELALMSNSIDMMITNNRRMMSELEASDRKKRDLELEMLRYQLNPHFLFNTLNTFKWIADINCLHNLRDGISSLAELLRSTLVQEEELIPIASEIENLKAYCTIQSLRYAGQFEVAYSVEDTSDRFRLPRFIMQPLMENAIIHGIRDNESELHIAVKGDVRDERLCLSISDDGVGFDISAVFDSEADKFTGIGLANVDSRLRLYYGDECRLNVRSVPGEGTVCSFSVPDVFHGEEKN